MLASTFVRARGKPRRRPNPVLGMPLFWLMLLAWGARFSSAGVFLTTGNAPLALSICALSVPEDAWVLQRFVRLLVRA